MKKKGLNQMDWVVSLGIFLLYLAWFFIFIKPQIQKTSDLMPLERIVQDHLDNEVYSTIEKYPIFIHSDKIQNGTIVFVNINNQTNFGITSGEDYFYYNNSLLMLQDFNNNTKHLWIAESNNNYSHTNQRLDLNNYNNTRITSKDVSVNFNNGLIESARYKNTERIENTNFLINNNPITSSDFTTQDYNILTEQKVELQSMNIISRVIAKNPVVWVSIEKNDADTDNNLTLQLELNNFINYYSDNNNYGNLTSGQCEEYTNDFIKLYDLQDSLSFILPEISQITFCSNETKTYLNLTLTIDASKEFFIIFDNNNFEEENFTDYQASKGIREEVTGIDTRLIDSWDYETKKTEWGYPSQNNFQITIWNSSLNDFENRNKTIFSLGNAPLTTREVYSKEYRDFLIDQNGELSEITVSVKTW